MPEALSDLVWLIAFLTLHKGGGGGLDSQQWVSGEPGPVCDSGEVGDEFHYLLNCCNGNVKRNRTNYVDKYYTHHPNVPKFCSLMNMTSKSKNVKLPKFISCIFELFRLSQQRNTTKKEILHICALALHIYSNFDLCLSISFCLIYKVW